MRIELTNDTRLLAVIGDPVGHSLSPLLQNTMIRALGREEVYLAVPVRRGGLGDFLAAARTLRFVGCNLTMPHKEDILPFLSDMTPEARRAGSVNSLRFGADGTLSGHSTDGLGFRRSLMDLGCSFDGQTVAILGAGGAARSIAMTAVDSGAKRVLVLNRTIGRAEALCAGEDRMEAHSLAEAEALLPEADLLINTTPLGMTGTGQTGAFDFVKALKPGAPAVDCVYSPPVTPFMEAARAWGHPTANGLGMLIYQAVYAYAFFHGETFSEEEVTRLGALLRGEVENSSSHSSG